MSYKFYFDKILLPVSPSKMTTKISNKNRTITTINDGEVSILKAPGLTEITFDLLLPNVEYPFAVYKNKFRKAKYYLDKFEIYKTTKTPFQFIVSRKFPDGSKLFNTNIKVSLEDYSVVEDAGNGFDVTVSIKLKQYKPFATKIIQLPVAVPIAAVPAAQKAVTVPAKKVTPPPVKKTSISPYTVKSGDCLWNICKRFLGDGSKYPQIAKLNGIKNPNLIYPGQVIRFS